MPANTGNLENSINNLVAQVERTRGTEASAAAALRGVGELVKAEIAKAIQADDEIDNSKIAELQAVVDNVISPLASSESDLAAAVAANASSGGSTGGSTGGETPGGGTPTEG